MLFVTLRSSNKNLIDLMEVPVIGSLLIFLIAIIPIPTLFLLNAFMNVVNDNILSKYMPFVASIWNIILSFGFKIQIGILYIPLWIVFLLIGIYRWFKL